MIIIKLGMKIINIYYCFYIIVIKRYLNAECVSVRCLMFSVHTVFMVRLRHTVSFVVLPKREEAGAAVRRWWVAVVASLPGTVYRRRALFVS